MNDQVARLNSGKITPEAFDYAYLKNKGEVYGQRALETLQKSSTPETAELIKRKLENPFSSFQALPRQKEVPFGSQDIVRNVTVYPQGKSLPDDFLNNDWHAEIYKGENFLNCFKYASSKCEAYIAAAPENAPAEVILNIRLATVFYA